MRHTPVLLAVAFASTLPALAQQSASFKLQESVLNAGGHPAGGATLASASFHVKLDAIGEGVIGTGLQSASFHADGSFVSTYTTWSFVSSTPQCSEAKFSWTATPPAAPTP